MHFTVWRFTEYEEEPNINVILANKVHYKIIIMYFGLNKGKSPVMAEATCRHF